MPEDKKTPKTLKQEPPKKKTRAVVKKTEALEAEIVYPRFTGNIKHDGVSYQKDEEFKGEYDLRKYFEDKGFLKLK